MGADQHLIDWHRRVNSIAPTGDLPALTCANLEGVLATVIYLVTAGHTHVGALAGEVRTRASRRGLGATTVSCAGHHGHRSPRRSLSLSPPSSSRCSTTTFRGCSTKMPGPFGTPFKPTSLRMAQ